MGNANSANISDNSSPQQTPNLNCSTHSNPSLSPKTSNHSSSSRESPTVLSLGTLNGTASSSALSPRFGLEASRSERIKTPKSKSSKMKFKFTSMKKVKSDQSSVSDDNLNDDEYKEGKEGKENNENNGNNAQNYVSIKIIRIAANFWNVQVNSLTFEKQLV